MLLWTENYQNEMMVEQRLEQCNSTYLPPNYSYFKKPLLSSRCFPEKSKYLLKVRAFYSIISPDYFLLFLHMEKGGKIF